MKVSELRIGNYVYFHGDVEEINMIDGCGVIGREDQPLCSVDDFDPIPLTEEWLLKFGFKLEGKYNSANRWMGIFNQPLIQGNGYFTLPNYPMVEIKYIHQLQNLYFALTGEELVVKE